ncbi:ORC complex protein Cdc6/Orc1 [Archaeoglobus sulfaticallidus PM70-1]|uniref:ORC1-type DNA replication protein n=1 Tax=Archaeoglobus sulfaticallidus PM70-1 TaxID=387631 RepID=N0BIE5_9EURY|nr:ORC1-type DNA replication protein [Archaeoglobus sulfaticallidus]AGK62062.1 ORC complex protein Cdc6/Orc1 [Archaeoglobus sulfaticallidus PM70-1]
MRFLAWDETLFKNPEVFDPDYIPEKLYFRDSQLRRISANLKPAIRKTQPVNMLCLGPPGTGKTSAIKLIFRELEDFDVIPVYANCQLLGSKQAVFGKIFEALYGYKPPSYGIPFAKLYASILNKVLEIDKVLVVALDDINLLLNDTQINDVLYAILKAYEEVDGVKTGVIAIGTDLKLNARLDERVGSIFHPDEILFPPYGLEEIFEILKNRCLVGFYRNVISDAVIERVAELTYETGDLRVGLYLLKMAGISAEERGSRKISIEDVEKAFSKSKVVLLKKCISMLNQEEREILKQIYQQDDISTGEMYKKVRKDHKIGYTKFYNIISKLENLRLIDLSYLKRGKGRTRSIVRRFDRETVLGALKEFAI